MSSSEYTLEMTSSAICRNRAKPATTLALSTAEKRLLERLSRHWHQTGHDTLVRLLWEPYNEATGVSWEDSSESSQTTPQSDEVFEWHEPQRLWVQDGHVILNPDKALRLTVSLDWHDEQQLRSLASSMGCTQDQAVQWLIWKVAVSLGWECWQDAPKAVKDIEYALSL